MNKLIKSFKGAKPSKIIKMYEKGTTWSTDIYLRPYPRNRVSKWMKELQDDSDESADAISRIYHLMAKFCGGCICDESGELMADDSQETVDFLLGIEDDEILPDLFKASAKVSGLSKVADGLLSAFEDDTEAEQETPNRKKRRSKGK